MSLATNLSTFCQGFRFNAANWNSGGGYFTDLSGSGNHASFGGSPSFVNISGTEWMNFTGTQIISFKQVAIGEISILAIFRNNTDGAAGTKTICGSANNIWRLYVNNGTAGILIGSNAATKVFTKNTAQLVVAGNSLEVGKNKISIAGGAVGEYTHAANHSATMNTVSGLIGAYNTDVDEFVGDLYCVYFFTEDLFLRNDLADIIADEMAPIEAGANFPTNTVAPSISGITQVGQTLTTSDGTWTGSPTPTYTYQWKNAGVAISGATNSTYVLQASDEGDLITVTVTGTNNLGSASATSAAVGPIDPASPPPEFIIEGTNLVPDPRAFNLWPLNANVAVTANSVTDESGGTTGDLIVDNAAGGTGTCSVQTAGITIAGTTNYRLSLIGKAGSLSWARIAMINLSDVTTATAYCNFSTGAFGNIGASITSSGVIGPDANGLYQFWVRFTSGADLAGNVNIRITNANNGNAITRDGTNNLGMVIAQLAAV